MNQPSDPKLDAAAALRALREGNQRFVDRRNIGQNLAVGQREDLAGEQRPFAIILGCSDSRVPAELVFDQGLGDLFVIRVAGNIVAPSQVGSVEFAAAEFGTRLVVVLGHSNCGVIRATVDRLREAPGLESRNLSSIVDRVTPTVSPLLEVYPGDDGSLLAAATRTNVLASVDQLRTGSDLIRDFCDRDELLIVGAHYDLASGVVDFFS